MIPQENNKMAMEFLPVLHRKNVGIDNEFAAFPLKGRICSYPIRYNWSNENRLVWDVNK